jgi:RNA polymerase sigma-70 factor (ECF subfamily)
VIPAVTDSELLGSTDAKDFGRFYERHVDEVTAFVGRRVREHDAVFDVVAETFARALARRGQFDPGRGPAIAWLLGIARNLIIDAARRERVAAKVSGPLAPALSATGDDAGGRLDVGVDGGGGELRDGLAALPPEQREALLRRFVLDQSYPEIAAEQRVSEQVARKRVSRGRAALRAYVSIAATVLIALAVAGVAVIAAGGNGGGSHAIQAGGGAQLTRLIDSYAFLRRPQTARDRVPFYNVLGRSASNHLTVLPKLTRALSVDGVDLTVYVVHITGPVGTLGHAGRSIPGYWLAVEASSDGEQVGSLVESGSGMHYPSADVNLGKNHLRLAVVPDGVARVTWSWPREFDPLQLRYRPPLTANATVHDNVAVGRVNRSVAPHAVTWYAVNGAVVYRTSEGPTSRTPAA